MEHRERIGIEDRGLRIALYNPILYPLSSILYPPIASGCGFATPYARHSLCI